MKRKYPVRNRKHNYMFSRTAKDMPSKPRKVTFLATVSEDITSVGKVTAYSANQARELASRGEFDNELVDVWGHNRDVVDIVLEKEGEL